MDHIITSERLYPDSKKVMAIRKMPYLKDVAVIQWLGGFVNYLAKFLPYISEQTSPICHFTKTVISWPWFQAHNEAFEKV